ncbi:probable branched-chain amino acids aminotransferase [Cephalotrichum gorgonifer]|uniref:Branched-chain-amino-acid aminotransferase n=1 Tax=Cephalotrichum gorgonifer TaxID=2041049 RepID=A0AAE8SRZ5_9PEZI|nr:probable branched-chain amino acids aminotransferase [Cephalotrichum gorgonifer]
MAPSATTPAAAASNGTNGTNGATKVAAPAQLDASKLTIERTKSPRPVPSLETANSGPETICTDHMVTATWTASAGWAAPRLHPYGPISLMPTASVLHYATECFEGLKAYRGYDGKLRLFRPDRNAERMVLSSTRISLPSFPPAELEKLMISLLSVDGARWIPRSRPGTFLYLRPTMIGTQPQLGVQASSEAMLYIIATYMPVLHSPAGGMHLRTSPGNMVRAWAGGFGFAKVGANYGPSLLATADARKDGFHQILWLYGDEGLCTEAGASNFFVVWKDKETGRTQLVTAPLDDMIILNGVTRRSVIDLVKERCPELEIVERRYTIQEVGDAYEEGRLVESFAAGTAYFICPISLIHHRGKDISAPMGDGEGGEYTLKIRTWLMDIMYGRVDNDWAVVIPEEE